MGGAGGMPDLSALAGAAGGAPGAEGEEEEDDVSFPFMMFTLSISYRIMTNIGIYRMNSPSSRTRSPLKFRRLIKEGRLTTTLSAEAYDDQK